MKKIIQDLVDGYKYFYSHQHENITKLADLSSTQKPRAMVITCCDSRIELGSLFNVAPGDLFVVRNVANIIPLPENDHASHGVSAALEFAVKFLHIEHIIILGHSNCGGIASLCHHTGSTEYIDQWMKHIHEAYKDLAPHHEDETKLLHALEKHNVVLGLKRLQEFSWIRDAIKEETLSIHGWYFDFKTATLSAYQEGTFIPFNKNGKKSHESPNPPL